MNAERIPTPKNRSLQTLKTVLAAATLATLAACSSTGSTSGDGSSGSGGSGTGAYGASAGGQYGSGGAYGSGGPAGGYVGGPGATQEQRVVYFDYDSADIRADSRPIIQAHAQYLQQTPGSVAILEGHADERGSREYNIALGERRGVAVRRAMEALGVSPQQSIQARVPGGKASSTSRWSVLNCWSSGARSMKARSTLPPTPAKAMTRGAAGPGFCPALAHGRNRSSFPVAGPSG